MPQVGVNNEPLFERAIFGFDGSDYRVVKVDTDGNLVAAVKASQTLTAQVQSYNGSAWLNQPVTFGYSGRLKVNGSSTSAGGTVTVTSPTVPSGEIWLVDNVSLRDASTGPHVAAIVVVLSGGGTCLLVYSASLAAQTPINLSHPIWLASGDYVYAQIIATTAGDVMQGGISGIKMKVA